MLADADRMARQLAKDPVPAAPPWCALLRAGIASTRGDNAAARSALEEAIGGFERAEMAAYREVARHALASLMPPGHERDELRAQAERWLHDQGVVRVDRFVATMCPGIAPDSP